MLHKTYLTATAQAMSQAEVEDIVDSAKLNEIKNKEEHPEIKIFSVGHEGDANINFPGMGHRVTTFLKGAVQALFDKLPLSTPIFEKHDPTGNEHDGRVKIGEVVGKKLQQVGDRLNVLAAVYIYPQFKMKPFDVASIETNIATETDGVANWPVAIDTISGIALGNSATDTPGFSGATLLGAMQAFADGDKEMDITEIQGAIKTGQFTPSDVFSMKDLKADSGIIEIIKSKSADWDQRRDRHFREMDELKSKLVSAEKLASESKSLKSENLSLKSTGVLGEIITERKLGEKEGSFLTKTLKNFRSEATDMDTMKSELNQYVDTGLKDFEEVAEIFGVKLDTVKGDADPPANTDNTNAQNTIGPTNVDDGKFRGDLSNPAKNDLISGGSADKALSAP